MDELRRKKQQSKSDRNIDIFSHHKDKPENAEEEIKYESTENILRFIEELTSMTAEELMEKRYMKYRKIGEFLEKQDEVKE